jgi:predicted TPR repeat methyltransferase
MPTDLLQLALSYHQAGDLTQAERLYRQLLEINPTDTNLLHAYSILLAQQHHFTAAEQFVRQALAIEPNSPTFHTSMGNILTHLKKFQDAIQHYEQSIQLQPKAPVAHNNLGNLYAKQADYLNAMLHYQKAIVLKPDYADAYYNLAIAQTKLDKNQDAIQSLTTALKIQPEFTQAHGQLGLLLQQGGDFSGALEHYQERIRLEPNHAQTYVNMGAILVKQGNLTQGIEHFKKALQIEPQHTEAHYNLGSTYLSMSKPDEALQHYLQSIGDNPDADTYFNIAVIYSYKDRHGDAIDYFNSALKLRPDFFESHVNLGATYLKIENYPKAIEHYQQALRLQPDNPEIEYILSAITEEHHKPTAAPNEFVSNLFDQYAPHFEKHLLQYLKYQAHTLLYNTVQEHLKNQLHDFTIIDLGCGTGLCGVLFKPHAKKLIGIDISSKMIDIAKEKDVYDTLIVADIIPALSDFENIDLIIAADVFGYIGDLAPVFQAVKSALKSEGYFAFTIEKTDQALFSLEKSTRFAHSKQYIHQLCDQFGFTLLSENEEKLRMQRQEPVIGYVYLLQAYL